MLICYSPREIAVIASREELIGLSSRISSVGGKIVSNQTGSAAPYVGLLSSAYSLITYRDSVSPLA